MLALTACAILVPLGIYALFLGVIHVRRRPYVITGAWDSTALALALSGLVLVGPVRLVLEVNPLSPLARHGPLAWLLLVGFIVSGVAMLISSQPRRLVLYNVGPADLERLLPAVFRRVDAEVQFRGTHVVLPSAGVELQVEGSGALRSFSLVASGPSQSLAGWAALRNGVADAFRSALVQPGRLAPLFLGVALLCVAAPTWLVLQHPSAMAQALRSVFVPFFQ